jgi:alanine dehydrogenase
MSSSSEGPLYVTEEDVHRLMDMRGAIDALRSAFLEQSAGEAQNSPRARARYWGSRLNIMSAGMKSGRFGFKAYAGTKAPTVYHVMLYDAERGLIAIIEARRLSRLRTGAATGLATDLTAKRGTIRLAMIGAGEQARTQLGAVAAVRPLGSTRVYARNRDRLVAFCADVSREFDTEIEPAASPQECVVDADVIITATDSETPVIRDEWLPANVHVNTIGANAANRMELELATFQRARIVATDDVDQAQIEAGEIIRCVDQGRMNWENVVPLAKLVANPPLPGSGLTIFKSLGAALEDVAAASAVYDLARAHGLGSRL